MTENISNEKKSKVISFISSADYVPMRVKDMAFLLSVPEADMPVFSSLIDQLSENGEIVITKKGLIALPSVFGLFTGVFSDTGRGFGFVKPLNLNDEENAESVFVSHTMRGGAMNKDVVLCRITQPKSSNAKAECEVLKIIKKGTDEIIGTYNGGYVTPDDKTQSFNIKISKGNLNGAKNADKVVVKIIKMPSAASYPEGEIVEVLGAVSNPYTEITAILRRFGISEKFSNEVMEEASLIPETVQPKDMEGRLDLREVLTVTIDSIDTKDIDDAVTLEVLENGAFRLGVHIADVCQYVKEGSPLDKEALRRGTSVYFLNKVIPMLPYKLSNGICSLNAGVDRLALSCIMDIDKNGNVTDHKIAETVIHVNRKLTYELVADLINKEDKSEYFKEYGEFMPFIKQMEALAEILRTRRFARGALEFGFTEAKIKVDENLYPTEVKAYDRNVATNIIEEFMLVCNETVAETYYWLDAPFVYRSHEKPDPDSLMGLSSFVKSFGYSIKGHGRSSGSVQALLSAIEGKPEEVIIGKAVLRSLKRASYTEKNLEHFGLAAKFYCHFTSPIRRYPDLQIHRIIKEFLAGNGSISESRQSSLKEHLVGVCELCSANERIADDCSREIELLKKVEFMEDKVGERFEGIVSGANNGGLFVALPNTIEGYVPFASLSDDYFIYNPETMVVTGERTKKTFRPGDKVSVTVLKAVPQTRQLHFALLNNF